MMSELPLHAVFGVLDGKTDGSKTVANKVGCGPILICLGLGTYLQQQIDRFLVGLE